ncbi:VOC family protein [Streptomyces albus subsp. chlorinus]|uniref:VOC family protein n=1 Tax=Streptomyces albus TaxID=1888 RepID=UPI00156F2F82|nr:VOC family protein [Streptomyces albus]NSC23655.1 VOC family protein [Streptomyces albus subsp. chlorinus]
MTSRIAVLCIDAVEPRRVADFWCRVLGWQIVEEGEDGSLCLGPPGKPEPGIDVLPVPERKTLKNRLHLDLRADGSSTGEELARLLELGARKVDVGQSGDADWTVLADPEGNEFCLLATPAQRAEGREN